MTYNNLEEKPLENKGIEPKKGSGDFSSIWDFITEMVKFTILSLVIVAPIRIFIAQPFLVSGSSMDPTFADGEYLIIDELSYYFKDPERGQVVVFRYPNNPSKYFIKRIIGLPSETVIVKNGQVTIKNDANPNGMKLEEDYVKNIDTQNKDVDTKLEDNEYFVMGDNRPQSSDSRDWGPVEDKFITGHVVLRLLPVARASVLPGQK